MSVHITNHEVLNKVDGNLNAKNDYLFLKNLLSTLVKKPIVGENL